MCPFFPFLSSSENIDKYNRVALFAGRRTIRIVNYHHLVFPLEVSRSGLKLFKPPQKRGEGCKRLTVFMQSRVPLGPSKFHVVVLVSFVTFFQYSSYLFPKAFPCQIS